MHETAQIRLGKANATKSAGRSLVQSLYTTPLTILMRGPLGAGKTTFMQGFAAGLGIEQRIVSPSFALEQRYKTEHWGELLHLDLYRLSSAEARHLVESSEAHEGIRCIEWAEKLSGVEAQHTIMLQFTECNDLDERILAITFADIALPTEDDISAWRQEVGLPKNIAVHCDTVGAFAAELASLLIRRGTVVRPLAVRRAGQLHDLMRFLDFHAGSQHLHCNATAEQRREWEKLRKRHNGVSHERAAEVFLHEHGYPAIASIIASHGLKQPSPAPETIEQNVLFYADKRVMFDQVVSLQERFADFAERYGGGKESPQSRAWLQECQRIEKELFPDGAPMSSHIPRR